MDNFLYECLMGAFHVVRAKEFARYIHRNQKRKDGVTPYFLHLERVADKVAKQLSISIRQNLAGEIYTFHYDLIVSSYCHDAVEDQEVSLDLLSLLFTWNVSLYVKDLTNIPIPPKESASAAAKRKSDDNQRIANSLPGTILIKLCDRLDNLQDLAGYGEKETQNFYKKTRDLILKLEASPNYLEAIKRFRADELVEELKKIVQPTSQAETKIATRRLSGS